MANNPHVNKVIYGDTTLIDLTPTTVTEETLAYGTTALDASGALITGKMIHSNKNILDNWDFIFPVNQREQLTITGSNKYLHDRWKSYGYAAAQISLVEDGAQIENRAAGTHALRQYLTKELPAGTYTLSAIVKSITNSNTNLGSLQIRNANTNIHSKTFDSDGLVTMTFTTDGTTSPINNISIACYSGNTIVISAVKLECGDVQTLAHLENNMWVLNELPNYGEELLKCQRYFQKFRTQALCPTYGADFRPAMATEEPVLSSFVIGNVTYYTASSET